MDKVDDFLCFLEKISSIEFDGERYTIPVIDESICIEFKIPFDAYAEHLKLSLRNYFENENVKYSEHLNSEVKAIDISKNIFLIDKNGTVIKYYSERDEYKVYGKNNLKLLIDFKNIIAYYKLFNFLISNQFADYFNDANNEIIVYSSINGIFKITYDTIPVVQLSEDINPKVRELINLGTPLELAPFFKNAIFSISVFGSKIGILEIILKTDDIITITKRDYELVSKKFDFNNFKDSLLIEKEKYFNNIREIVNKIFSQAIGIPVSISATVFATYKVSDDIYVLVIILIAFLTYVIFYIVIQKSYQKEIKYIKEDFLKDFNIIREDSGLPNNVINVEREKIERKILHSLQVIKSLMVIAVILGFLVFSYVLHEIFAKGLNMHNFIFGIYIVALNLYERTIFLQL